MTAERTSKHAKPKSSKGKKAIIIISIIMCIVLLLVSGFFAALYFGKISLRGKSEPSLPGESYEDADAYYNGVAYNYNNKLINILLIGVDEYKPAEGDIHQSDSLNLISLDTEAKKLNIIPISRNTLTQVDSYDINGNFFGTSKQQICYAYTYSDDDKKSSENTVKAVSNLFYGLPISGYYTIFMDSLGDIVDSVGGVPMQITEDMTVVDPSMVEGANVRVNGENAMYFLRYRTDSNAPRLERQKIFIKNFLGEAKNACLKDISLPVKMYNKLASNTVTDITSASAAYLASEAIKCEFKIHNIEGVTGTDGTYETFTPNEDSFYELLLDVFYKKK